MVHNNTVFSQSLKFIPRHEFESLSNKYHTGQSFRNTSRWSQIRDHDGETDAGAM